MSQNMKARHFIFKISQTKFFLFKKRINIHLQLIDPSIMYETHRTPS